MTFFALYKEIIYMKNKNKVITPILIIALFSLTLAMFAACDLFGGGNGSNNPRTVTVTLDLNGGSGVTQLTLTGEAGTPMQLPTPTRVGFTFDGWFNDWSAVSQTEFPATNMTLTARYRTNSGTDMTVSSIRSPLNQTFSGGGVATTSFNFQRENFNVIDWQQIEWLRSNPSTAIYVSVSYEARTAAIQHPQNIDVWLSGAHLNDRIATPDRIPEGTFEEIAFSGPATAQVMVGQPNSTIVFRLSRNLVGAALNPVYELRNIELTITYVRPAGTLV